MQTHDIKILPCYFEDVAQLNKPFEVRIDDRNYSVGDIVNFHEFDGHLYTGRQTSIQISYVLRNIEKYGLHEGYCIFAWKDILRSSLS